MVQELMCGQRQAPMLQLASRLGGNRRVVECLQRLSTAAYMVMPVGGTIPNFREKAPFIICAPRPGPVSDASVNPQISGRIADRGRPLCQESWTRRRQNHSSAAYDHNNRRKVAQVR